MVNLSVSSVGKGISVKAGVAAKFSKVISHANDQCDWYIEDGATVHILGDYCLLGAENTIGDTQVSVNHNPGDGNWTLTTIPMEIKTDTGKTATVFVEKHSSTYVQWSGTADAGTSLHQKIGGLQPNTLYDLFINGKQVGTATAYLDTMLFSTTGAIWFNYTGPWSTHAFEVKIHEEKRMPLPFSHGKTRIETNDVMICILDGTGTMPVQGATVYVVSIEGSLIASGITDVYGIYTADLEDGTYTVRAYADGSTTGEYTMVVCGDGVSTLMMQKEENLIIWLVIAIIVAIMIMLVCYLSLCKRIRT